jgi:hypothetical protein
MHKVLLASVLVLAASPAWAHGSHHDKSGNNRAAIGNDITIDEGETTGDVACAFCSVHVHGDVHGDVAVAFGSVTVDQDKTVSGDMAVAGGDVSLKDSASIGGDLALVGGDLNLAPDASVHGNKTILPWRGWLLVPLAPFLILAGIIWLIVWFFRRNRQRSPFYPPGRTY